MHDFLPYAWFKGRCVPFEEAKLSIATHALHYGTGAFGGMRAIPDPEDNKKYLLYLYCLSFWFFNWVNYNNCVL